jgi:hypothetical protein
MVVELDVISDIQGLEHPAVLVDVLELQNCLI